MKSKVAPIFRKYPYPYKAMLAICSDLDETPDKDTYFEIMKYLNTNEMTRIGKGVGLEIGNTIYFDMPSDHFSYWGTDDHGRELIHRAIKGGFIDCLHSFGDNATNRSQIERSLRALEEHGCKLDVWIDHARAITNLDNGIMCGRGDDPESEVFHGDLSWQHGIRFVWKGRVTSVIGQQTKKDFRGIFSVKHPIKSSKTIGKEIAKIILGKLGNTKYLMHAQNELLHKTSLGRGHRVYEFIRANPHYAGVSSGETADGLHEVVTHKFLNTLIEKEGIIILYTHLGKTKHRDEIFPKDTRTAFEALSNYYKQKRILVTTTRRLLGYCRAISEMAVKADNSSDTYLIKVATPYEGRDLQGVSFYIPDNKKAVIELNGNVIDDLHLNERDETGRRSVSIPWNKLVFPSLDIMA